MVQRTQDLKFGHFQCNRCVCVRSFALARSVSFCLNSCFLRVLLTCCRFLFLATCVISAMPVFKKMAGKGGASNPRAVADAIIAALPATALFERTEVAGPGFINVYLADAFIVDRTSFLLQVNEVLLHAD